MAEESPPQTRQRIRYYPNGSRELIDVPVGPKPPVSTKPEPEAEIDDEKEPDNGDT